MNKLLLIFSLFFTSVNAQNNDSIIYDYPLVLPEFRYDTCTNTVRSLKMYFAREYNMPLILQDSGFTGRLIFEVVIERDGSLSFVKMLRGIDKGLDSSVIEAVKRMPRWEPASYKGSIVRSRTYIHVNIRWLYGFYEE
jgi:protein TonB